MRWRITLLVVATLGSTACRLGFDEASVNDDDVELAVAPASMNVSSAIALDVTGGLPPYAFAKLDGVGTLDATAGVYRSPPFPEDAHVSIVDAAGTTITGAIHVGGSHLYVAGGGNSGVDTDTVYRSADGVTWELAGQLPAVRSGGAMVVLDDTLYYLGGTDGTTRQATAWSSTDGVTWSALPDLPGARQSVAAAVFHDQIVLGGGYSPATDFTMNLWIGDGSAWTTHALPVQVHGTVFVPFRDELWMLGGHDANGFMDQSRATSDGQAWTTHPVIPLANEYHGVTVFRDRAWLCGGIQLLDRCVSTADGDTWIDEVRMPVQRTEPQLIPWNGELWLVTGGQTQVLHSPDGTSWSVAGDYPLMLTGSRVVQFTPR